MLKNDDFFTKIKFGFFVFGLIFIIIISFMVDFFSKDGLYEN